MLVCEIDSATYNYVVVASLKYFLLPLPTLEIVVVNDRCPHRGGPLHLGIWRHESSTIECPWHGTCWTLRTLRHRGLIVPSVRRGQTVTAIFEQIDPMAPVDLAWKEKRPMEGSDYAE